MVSYSRLNPEPPEHEIGILTTQSEFLVHNGGFFVTIAFSNWSCVNFTKIILIRCISDSLTQAVSSQCLTATIRPQSQDSAWDEKVTLGQASFQFSPPTIFLICLLLCISTLWVDYKYRKINKKILVSFPEYKKIFFFRIPSAWLYIYVYACAPPYSLNDWTDFSYIWYSIVCL